MTAVSVKKKGWLFMSRKPLKRAAASAVLLVLLINMLYMGSGPVLAEGGEPAPMDTNTQEQSVDSLPSYTEYLEKTDGKAGAGETLLTHAECTGMDDASSLADNYENSGTKSVNIAANGYATWEFNIAQAGLYTVSLDYIVLPYNDNTVEFSFLLDGQIPYSELQFLNLYRLWRDVPVEDTAYGFKTDLIGNDIEPQQEEVREWREVQLTSSSGFYTQPLQVYLTAGKHTATIRMLKETAAVRAIRFQPPKTLKSYDDLLAEYAAQGYADATGEPLVLEAEKPALKSNFTIVPLSDKSSAVTSPQSADSNRLNTIGGNRWLLSGQWINWTFTVPQSGLYTIGLRFRQKENSGMFSSRLLKIDGEIPFAEAQDIKFSYSTAWQYDTLGPDGGYKFYFEQGREYTLTLEATLGEMGAVISYLSDILSDLNQIYRDILMVTGPIPDRLRDYKFPLMIPSTLEKMKTQEEALRQGAEMLIARSGDLGEHTAIINNLAYQLERMYSKPDVIAANFQQFKDNIGALGTLLQTLRNQPLELDTITFSGAANPAKVKKDSALSNLWLQIKMFFYSFVTDYSGIGTSLAGGGRDKLTVWVATGRDQAKIIRSMVDNDYTPNSAYDVSVQIELVAAGTLLPATLAGIGPDVSLSSAMTEPVDFAVRNAAMDLTQFDDLDEVLTRFHESAVTPFSFRGGVYALPETQTFPMMFYRTDVFSNLGLTVPETWEDFYALLPDLLKNSLEIGFPIGYQGIQIFLYQNGQSLYNEDLTKHNIETDLAFSSFKSACDMFSIYKCPVEYVFVNRFRTGEMPLGIADYSTTYNTLTVFAPEIKGLWEMVPLPATKNKDGTLSNVAPSTSTGVMMMSQTKVPEIAWEFMKWWTDEPAMKKFALEMEAVLGPSAKQPVANQKAFQGLSWSKNELDGILAQWDKSVGTPQVPGGYLLERQMNFAFTRIVNEFADPAEVLQDYTPPVNKELERKRKELGLD